jgi:hypothetical protein
LSHCRPRQYYPGIATFPKIGHHGALVIRTAAILQGSGRHVLSENCSAS